MVWDKDAIERLLLERPNGKPKEERDEYDELYHETRRRLAIERAIRDDRKAAARNGRAPKKYGPIPPRPASSSRESKAVVSAPAFNDRQGLRLWGQAFRISEVNG